jgi:hypothetical protein
LAKSKTEGGREEVGEGRVAYVRSASREGRAERDMNERLFWARSVARDIEERLGCEAEAVRGVEVVCDSSSGVSVVEDEGWCGVTSGAAAWVGRVLLAEDGPTGSDGLSSAYSELGAFGFGFDRQPPMVQRSTSRPDPTGRGGDVAVSRANESVGCVQCIAGNNRVPVV